MIGCDLHDVSIFLKVAVGTEKPTKRSFLTSNAAEMVARLTDFANRRGSERIVFTQGGQWTGFRLV